MTLDRDGGAAPAAGSPPPPGERTRVVLLGSFPPQSQGISDYCGELALALAEHYRVTALGFSSMYPAAAYPGSGAATDPSASALRAPGLEVRHTLSYKNPLSWAKAALLDADVLHAQWWSLPLWPVYLVLMAAMRLRGKLVVITLHNLLPHEGSRLFVPATRILCRLAHRVVVHCPGQRRRLEEAYKLAASDVRCVPHLALRSKVRSRSAAEARQVLGLPADAVVTLLFGAIRSYKGTDVLLRAFAEVARRERSARLVIAGRPWVSWAPYAALVGELGLGDRVHLFLDYIPDRHLCDFFAAAELVALPYTTFEAQSCVAALALPYGKPLIVTRAGGLPEWVDHDERWIAEPGSSPSLAAKLADFFAFREERVREFRQIAGRVLRRATGNDLLAAYAGLYQLGPAETGPGVGA